MHALYLLTIIITITLAVEDLKCNKLPADCQAGLKLQVDCGVCDPSDITNALQPIKQCIDIIQRFPVFPRWSLVPPTTRESIRPAICGAKDGFKCHYTIICDLVSNHIADNYELVIQTRVVTTAAINMAKQDPVDRKSAMTNEWGIERFRQEIININAETFPQINYDNKIEQKYDFIVLSTNPQKIRFSNRVVGHTSMITPHEYASTKDETLKVIWAGSFTLKHKRIEEDGIQRFIGWILLLWENDSGHFLPDAGVDKINAKRFGKYWNLDPNKFVNRENQQLVQERINVGVETDQEREAKLQAILAAKARGDLHPKKKKKKRKKRRKDKNIESQQNESPPPPQTHHDHNAIQELLNEYYYSYNDNMDNDQQEDEEQLSRSSPQQRVVILPIQHDHDYAHQEWLNVLLPILLMAICFICIICMIVMGFGALFCYRESQHAHGMAARDAAYYTLPQTDGDDKKNRGLAHYDEQV